MIGIHLSVCKKHDCGGGVYGLIPGGIPQVLGRVQSRSKLETRRPLCVHGAADRFHTSNQHTVNTGSGIFVIQHIDANPNHTTEGENSGEPCKIQGQPHI